MYGALGDDDDAPADPAARRAFRHVEDARGAMSASLRAQLDHTARADDLLRKADALKASARPMMLHSTFLR